VHQQIPCFVRTLEARTAGASAEVSSNTLHIILFSLIFVTRRIFWKGKRMLL
jgi:hypothetical protein